MQLLLEKGANVNAHRKDGCATPLRVAVVKQNLPMITILLAADAWPNSRDAVAATPLHWAAEMIDNAAAEELAKT